MPRETERTSPSTSNRREASSQRCVPRLHTRVAGCVLAFSIYACGDDSSADAGLDAADAGTDATDGGIDAVFDAGPPPPPESEPGRHDVTIVDTRLVVPGDGLPPEAPSMTSNNNLDVIRYEGRVYLAFRTAPDHFAGPETLMHVVSSDDELTWVHEATFDFDTDLREPRFLVLEGRLLFYFSILGTNRFRFEPMGVQMSERSPDGSWTDPVDIGMTGYVVWRTRTERGTPYMSAYLGGEHIYLFDGLPLDVELRTTIDGVTWTPIAADPGYVYRGGGSEMDFTLDDAGNLLSIIRNEAGDETGWGSLVCRADAASIADWTCLHDPKKYDSPLMFWHDGEAYLVGRRNVTESGQYDLETPAATPMITTVRYQVEYSNAPKRCSVWRWVQDEDRIAYVTDLPSRGDTCFPARIDSPEPNQIILYNYSSDIDGPDLAWNAGQEGETFIYRHVLEFTPR